MSKENNFSPPPNPKPVVIESLDEKNKKFIFKIFFLFYSKNELKYITYIEFKKFYL